MMVRVLILAVLLTGSLLPTVFAVRQPATIVKAAGCNSFLSLTLQPGQHFPGARPLPIPGDLPPGPIDLKLPLYPGATSTTETERQPSFGAPANPYMKSASAMYNAPAGEKAVTAWYKSAFAACGYTLQGTQSSGRYGQQVSQGITETRNQGRDSYQIALSFEPSTHGGTLVLYVAIALTPPAYPVPGSVLRVPGNPISLIITQVSGLNGGLRPTRTVTVRNVSTVRSLANEINHLPKVAGIFSCPADTGSHDTLVFTDTDGSRHIVQIGLGGCRLVSAPPAPAGRLYDDPKLLPRIMALLATGHPVGFLYNAHTLRPTGTRYLGPGRFLSTGQNGQHLLYLSGHTLVITNPRRVLAHHIADAGLTIDDQYAVVRRIGAGVSNLLLIDTKTGRRRPFHLPSGAILLGRNAGSGSPGLSDALTCNLQHLAFQLGHQVRGVNPEHPSTDRFQTTPILGGSGAGRLIAVSCNADQIAVYHPGQGIVIRSAGDANGQGGHVLRRIAVGDVTFLSWSPDERYLAYRSGAGLHIVNLQTGHRHLALRLGSDAIQGATWDPWNRIIALSLSPPTSPTNARVVLAAVGGKGGAALPLPFRGAERIEWSTWTGRLIGITRQTATGDQVWVASLPSAIPPDPATAVN